MVNDDPIAFFITWTTYGTHLQGDDRGWTRRQKGEQLPEKRLAHWQRKNLNHEPVLLKKPQRIIIENAIRDHCVSRSWKCWAINARTNHVHVVVTATSYSGQAVRDQFKANATRMLRSHFRGFVDQPVWTRGGDWKCINNDNDLETVCQYVLDAQDRKDRDNH